MNISKYIDTPKILWVSFIKYFNKDEPELHNNWSVYSTEDFGYLKTTHKKQADSILENYKDKIECVEYVYYKMIPSASELYFLETQTVVNKPKKPKTYINGKNKPENLNAMLEQQKADKKAMMDKAKPGAAPSPYTDFFNLNSPWGSVEVPATPKPMKKVKTMAVNPATGQFEAIEQWVSSVQQGIMAVTE